ncbi:MAG TPA: hypothetical protein VF285_00945 [Castellaniella sp.]
MFKRNYDGNWPSGAVPFHSAFCASGPNIRLWLPADRSILERVERNGHGDGALAHLLLGVLRPND